eukprot:TRINITY_DN63369_c0_g1_i1.p1 TRINITY_DN63369_c0_g1~~TRINITY_DN63369_c0_g1_i1.p1  ORF type:complete len:1070 (-),score=181.23 TRINITY_DN63369_c0_g1_i1:1975-5184(-)
MTSAFQRLQSENDVKELASPTLSLAPANGQEAGNALPATVAKEAAQSGTTPTGPCSTDSPAQGGEGSPGPNGDHSGNKNLQDALQTLGEHLQQAMAEKVASQQKLVSETKRLKNKNANTDKRVQELEQTLALVEKKHHDEKEELQQQIQLLEQQLEEQKWTNQNLLQQLGAEADHMNEEQEKWKDEELQKEMQIQQLHGEVAILRMDCDRKGAELEELRALKDQKGEVDRLAATILGLQQELASQRDSDELLTAELDLLKVKNNDLEIQLRQLQETSNATPPPPPLPDTVDQATCTDLDAQYVEQLEKAQQDITGLVSEMEAMRSKNTTTSTETEKMQEELNAANHQVKLLEAKLDEQLAANEEGRAQWERARARTEETQQLLLEMQRRWGAEREQLEELRYKAAKEATDLMEKLSSEREKGRQAGMQSAEVKEKFTQLELEITNLQSALESSKSDTEAAVLACEDTQRRMDKATANVGDLNDQISELKEHIAQQNKQIEKLDEEVVAEKTLNVQLAAERAAQETILQRQLLDGQVRESQLEEKAVGESEWAREVQERANKDKERVATLERDVTLLKEALQISEKKNQHYLRTIALTANKIPQHPSSEDMVATWGGGPPPMAFQPTPSPVGSSITNQLLCETPSRHSDFDIGDKTPGIDTPNRVTPHTMTPTMERSPTGTSIALPTSPNLQLTPVAMVPEGQLHGNKQPIHSPLFTCSRVLPANTQQVMAPLEGQPQQPATPQSSTSPPRARRQALTPSTTAPNISSSVSVPPRLQQSSHPGGTQSPPGTPRAGTPVRVQPAPRLQGGHPVTTTMYNPNSPTTQLPPHSAQAITSPPSRHTPSPTSGHRRTTSPHGVRHYTVQPRASGGRTTPTQRRPNVSSQSPSRAHASYNPPRHSATTPNVPIVLHRNQMAVGQPVGGPAHAMSPNGDIPTELTEIMNMNMTEVVTTTTTTQPGRQPEEHHHHVLHGHAHSAAVAKIKKSEGRRPSPATHRAPMIVRPPQQQHHHTDNAPLEYWIDSAQHPQMMAHTTSQYQELHQQQPGPYAYYQAPPGAAAYPPPTEPHIKAEE